MATLNYIENQHISHSYFQFYSGYPIFLLNVVFSNISQSNYGAVVIQTPRSNVTMKSCAFFLCNSINVAGFYIDNSESFFGKRLSFSQCDGKIYNNFRMFASSDKSNATFEEINFIIKYHTFDNSYLTFFNKCNIINTNTSTLVRNEVSTAYLFTIGNVPQVSVQRSHFLTLVNLYLENVGDFKFEDSLLSFQNFIISNYDSHITFLRTMLLVESFANFTSYVTNLTFINSSLNTNWFPNAEIENPHFGDIPPQVFLGLSDLNEFLIKNETASNIRKRYEEITSQLVYYTPVDVISFSHCIFQEINSGSEINYGAIYISSGKNFSINICTFSNCTGEQTGGIYSYCARYNVKGTCFLNNNAIDTSHFLMGIYSTSPNSNETQTLVFSDVHIMGPLYPTQQAFDIYPNAKISKMNVSHVEITDFSEFISTFSSSDFNCSLSECSFNNCHGSCLLGLSSNQALLLRTVFHNLTLSQSLIKYGDNLMSNQTVVFDSCSFFNIHSNILFPTKPQTTLTLKNCVGDSKAVQSFSEISLSNNPYPLNNTMVCINEIYEEDNFPYWIFIIVGAVVIIFVATLLVCYVKMHSKVKKTEERTALEQSILNDFG